ncbi:MAG TPA: hypothetical protein VHK00_02495 [Miltoncostaeaceae bacterium]|jgi:hypothetical protein|nr:hypothetical protein [Miltoncostaeaceae bacterium]
MSGVDPPHKVLGWRTQDIRDGAVTGAKLAASREGQPRWAVVTAGTGALSRAKGATAAAKRRAVPPDRPVLIKRAVSIP